MLYSKCYPYQIRRIQLSSNMHYDYGTYELPDYISLIRPMSYYLKWNATGLNHLHIQQNAGEILTRPFSDDWHIDIVSIMIISV